MTPMQRMPGGRSIRPIAVAGVLGLALLAGWRISHLMLADAALADGDAVAALGWQADHPDALLAHAEAQLRAQQPESAARTARHLLQVQPTDGRGYRLLAQVAAVEGRPAQALALFLISARRSPRDLPARAWLAQHALEQGDANAALVQIDQVLTLSPASGTTIFPVLLTLAKDPGFADALADALQRNPPWRAGMLAMLRQASAEDRPAAEQVMGALQGKGGLAPAEAEALIDALLRAGRWGEAHARWAAPIVAGGTPLPVLFNADFAQEPSGAGFDWRMPPTPGVILDFEHGQGAARTLHARFLGRRVVGTYLEHALFLAPGNYHLQLRQRSDALRSEAGISWTLTCASAPATALAESPALNGSRPWAAVELAFVVPAEGCQGQWLRMGNAGGGSIGQVVGGEAWVNGFSILRRGQIPDERH